MIIKDILNKKWCNICKIFTKNDEKNSDEFLQINKKYYMANWFPSKSAAFLLKDVYYQEKFDYLEKTKRKFPLRLSANLDMSKKDSILILGYKKRFWREKIMKMNWIKNFTFYSSDNEDDILLQLKTWIVNEENNITLMKTNDDIEEIFKLFLILHKK